MIRPPYPTDLTDAQWAILAPLVPAAKPGGRPRSADIREVVNAVLDHLRNGGTWRSRPHDLPPWKTVSHSFRSWRLDGTWERIHEALRDAVRRADGRDPSPSAAILASQSVKTTEKGGLGATTPGRR